MNPISYSATQALDNALVGRFGIFLYPPAVLQMDDADRIKVAAHINGDDAPTLSEWTGSETAGAVALSPICGRAWNPRQCALRRAGKPV